MARVSLREALRRLESRYGKPRRPRVRDPFEQILYENASYLVDDQTRAEVFASLKKRIGTTPERLLAAEPAAIVAAIRDGGMLPAHRAEKVKRAARIAAEEDVPLARVVRRPLPDAKKVLRRFPGVAEAGAERIALFAGAHAVLGLESNGLRVLTRLGFGREHADWNRTWRGTTRLAEAELPREVSAMQRAHALLRRHGQELCKRNNPLCAECPLCDRCAYGAGRSFGRLRRPRE